MSSTVAAIVHRAIGKPGYIRHGFLSHEWDISGSCLRPATREIFGRPLIRIGRSYDMHGSWEKPMSMILHTRCRKCETCMRLRASEWTYRAISEVREAARTWFGTLTLSPESQHLMVSRARQRLWSGGTDFDMLSPNDQFSERMREIGREVTLYLKRVRKESGAALRYIIVAEAHLSGAPHLHILVHEADIEKPVRYATLAKQWKLGFTKFKLARDVKAAAYVCKYISKALMARVRASQSYGKDREGTERPNVLGHSDGNGSVHKNAPEKRSEQKGELEQPRARANNRTVVDAFAQYASSLTALADASKELSNELLPWVAKVSDQKEYAEARLSEPSATQQHAAAAAVERQCETPSGAVERQCETVAARCKICPLREVPF